MNPTLMDSLARITFLTVLCLPFIAFAIVGALFGRAF